MNGPLWSEMEAMLEAYGRAGIEVTEKSRNYARSICWRVQFISQHRDMIGALNWNTFWAAGSIDHQSGEVLSTDICLKGGSNANRLVMRVSCKIMSVSFLYKWFEDLVSGAVNAQDTLGRLLNSLHGPRVPEEQASLGRLRREMREDCLFAKLLDVESEFIQLSLLRPIRGTLQHSAFEHVIRRPESNAGEQGVIPMIHSEIDIGKWATDRRVPVFCDRIVQATTGFLRDCATVLGRDPKSAIVMR